ncbi:aldehyde dehydrogenase [Gordonibacter sp. An230]|uniref:aldehyde dehydrogenase family protein n=1 Tax=Gordonibacter sp. An230 TaxID=1965592 RepID=UPI000B3A449E|nr:aldehyde dehydrogenase family protein [Gordonibacter sp. An230]OUO88635.1 aldehyde dehydrogenase [Gordonibacter sp. An230]
MSTTPAPTRTPDAHEATTPPPTPYTGLDKLFIAGAWRDGGSGERARDVNPYDGSTLAVHTLADKNDVQQAFEIAEQAQAAWEQTPPSERAAVMNAAVRIFDARREELIAWVQRETGGIRAKAEFEVTAARDAAEEAASFPYRMDGDILPSDIPGKENRVYRRALGTIAVISPWNFPMNLSNRSVAPALAVGNAVVLKPASDTPIAGGLLLAKIYEEAGLPAGVLSVVVGRGGEIGDAMVESSVPRLVSFTGSTAVGKSIAAKALGGSRMKRLALELGGNAPLVVLDDADAERAANIAIAGRFLHQGQICMSTNRIIVDAKLADEFTERFVAHAAKLACGNQMDPATDIGPIINEAQLSDLLQKIARARDQGATLALGGEPDGLVMPPVVFTDVDPAFDIAEQESFGPLAPIIVAHGEDEALRFANRTNYGLSSAVVGGDVERAVAFARKIDAGMTHVNDMTVADERHVPFGGEKNSGLGRFNGRWILEEMTRTHWTSVQHAPRAYPF